MGKIEEDGSRSGEGLEGMLTGGGDIVFFQERVEPGSGQAGKLAGFADVPSRNVDQFMQVLGLGLGQDPVAEFMNFRQVAS